jgi:hypothetical protein
MNDHKYTLEPYKGISTRYECPGCHKHRTFVRYIDSETGEHLNPSVGRCNREVNCGYHYTPKQFFSDNPDYDNPIHPNKCTHSTAPVKVKPASASFISVDTFRKSLNHYTENNFIKYLSGIFNTEVTNHLIERYFIGSSKHWPGATVFWQIDRQGRIRTGKIMLYDHSTGKRIKIPHNHITWVHSALKLPDFNLQQCFFGEHLLKSELSKPVAIVESEKTAVIASAYLPKFIWLAVGSLTNLSPGKFKCLRNRNVFLFPDLNCFEKWSDKAKEITKANPCLFIEVSVLLEQKASEFDKSNGLDIADYLTQYDIKEFTARTERPIPEPPKQITPPTITLPNKKHETPLSEFHNVFPSQKFEPWDISELETFFRNTTLPTGPIQLNPWTRITDPAKFVASELEFVKHNNGNPTFKPYLDRLIEFKASLQWE